jgi:hypothetical protein
MNTSPIEGIVENGQIRVLGDVVLPENARAYIFFPAVGSSLPIHLPTPRLAHPEQARDFVKQVSDVSVDAGL